MGDCREMKEGEVYICEDCGLELKVVKACSCQPGSQEACQMPIVCCGKEMVKKS